VAPPRAARSRVRGSRTIVLLLALALLATLWVAASGARPRASRPPLAVAKAIQLASLTQRISYGDMVSVSYCETAGTFDPAIVNPRSHATGLFQFLGSTWQHTPFAALDRRDPYANAMAAAWLVRHDGDWHEWDCRP
jgi:hypothetical protein